MGCHMCMTYTIKTNPSHSSSNQPKLNNDNIYAIWQLIIRLIVYTRIVNYCSLVVIVQELTHFNTWKPNNDFYATSEGPSYLINVFMLLRC
jgi:hypothetical protein